ncbi:MAG: hypothetical protein HFH10_07360 [Dorea sp.]|nr:hypothetical protein [Dorea sp.]
MENSHLSRSIWVDFICDTLKSESLNNSKAKLGFSHQTAFNMRYKVLMTLQDMLEKEPVLLSGITELDEIFVLDCYKGKYVPEEANPLIFSNATRFPYPQKSYTYS